MDPIRAKLAEAGTVFGGWLSLPDPAAAEAMAQAGYDILAFDTQHGILDWHSLLALLRAAGTTPALVRVGWIDPMQIMRALDLGAAGVIVPMVSTPEQARIAAEACRYPPRGNRSFGPVRNYYAGENKPAPLSFAMIETAEGLDNLDAIAATPELDGLFVGPVDLALSLGEELTFQVSDQVFAAVDKVVAACKRNNIIAGVAGIGRPNARQMVEHGMQFVTLGSDLLHIRQAAAAEIAEARGWLEKG